MPAKEILVYTDLYDYSAADIIRQLNEAKDSDVVLRFNSNGGELRYAWALLAKAKELKGKKLFKNDGGAHSMCAFAFCYNDNNEAIDTATFSFHRASYGHEYENDPDLFTTEDKQELADKNAKLRAALVAKVNVQLFEMFGKCSVDAMFSMDSRRDVTITAEQALKCGLINRVNPITPGYSSEISAHKKAIEAKYQPLKMAATTEPIKSTVMNKDTLKTEHPALYAEILATASSEATAKEKERVEAWAYFSDVDPKAVKDGIASGKPLTQLQIIEFSEKKMSAKSVKALEDEGAPPITTKKEPVTATAADAEKAKIKAEYEKAMDEQFRQMYPNSKRRVTA